MAKSNIELNETDDSPVAKFCEMSQGDHPADPFAFIREHRPTRADQLEIVLLDQARRSQLGEPIPAERYLAELPDLDADASSRLDVVYAELRSRAHDRDV